MKKKYIAARPFSSAVFGNVSQGGTLELNDAQAAQLIQHGLIIENAPVIIEPPTEKPKTSKKKKQ